MWNFQYTRVEQESGQAGLVVLLLTVVMLTVGIAIASRATTDVTLSRQEEESNRTFNAAEAGVEEALSQNLNFSGNTLNGSVNVDNDVTVNYTIDKVYTLETRLFEGVSAQVDVNGATNSNGLVLSWAKETACGQTPAGLLVTVFGLSGGVTTTRTLGYKACGGTSDGLSEISTNPSGELFRTVTISLQTGDQFVRIKPLYNDTYIRVQGSGWTLPVQYYRVRSVAENDLGNETRAVQVNRTKSVAPAIFDFVLYSGSTIIK